MKHILITTIAAVLLVGCSESQPKRPDISIHKAAALGNIEAVKQHLATGTDVNAKDLTGFAPLVFAASCGHKEIVELLIAKGADVNVKNSGKTPLDWAIKQSHTETAELLHKHGGKRGSELPLATLFEAVKQFDLQGVKDFLAKGADVNAKDDSGWTPLIHAANRGHNEVAALLIAKGADVNAKNEGGVTTLSFAVSEGHKEIAELLIAKGADVNAKDDDGDTALHLAAWEGHKEVVELLIAKDANVNAKCDGGMNPLHKAAGAGHKEIIELLIAAGADVNAKTQGGLSPLDWAIDLNHHETASLLRKRGGKTAKELKVYTSIHEAAEDGNLGEVKRYLAAGTDVDAKNIRGTPLHDAAASGHKEIVELLINEGADVNAKRGDGWTPLHRAAYKGHKELAELLIAGGGDVNAKTDVGGRTPKDMAILFKHIETADLLSKHGGKTGEELKAEGK